MNEVFCKELQESMSTKGYKNKDVRNKNTDHDHISSKKFSNWDDAISTANELKDDYNEIVNLKIVEK